MKSIGQPLLILGMHRSGTSFLAGLLQSLGVYIGDQLVGPQKGNPRGHFEAVPILGFHEEILKRTLSDQTPTFDKGIFVTEEPKLSFSQEDREEAKGLLKHLQREGVWGWKEPRTCLFLDLWRDLLPNARSVMVYRHPLEVHQSLLRRGHWGLGLYHGLAIQTYTVFNQALLEWNNPENYIFNASAGFADIPALEDDLRKAFGLCASTARSTFVPEEFHSIPISPSLHKLTALLFPEAAQAFDSLQERAARPYQFEEREDDDLINRLTDLLSVYLEGTGFSDRAHVLPMLERLLSGRTGRISERYDILSSAICDEHESLEIRYKKLGEEFKQQQGFLKQQSQEQDRLWKEFKGLTKAYSEQQEFLNRQTRDLEKQWKDFQALGDAYSEQQAFLKSQSEKYDKIWENHLNLKEAHEWITDRFRTQQESFAKQTSELQNLYERHRELGEAFSSQQEAFQKQKAEQQTEWKSHQALGVAYTEQQEFLRRQTAVQEKLWEDYKALQADHKKLGAAFSEQQTFLRAKTDEFAKVWKDYVEVQGKYKNLGDAFKVQQVNFSKAWDDLLKLHEENRRLKQKISAVEDLPAG